MQSKSLLIAIAAFAVTTTGVHAYGGEDILEKAGLSEEQKSALAQAHVLRSSGDVNAARDVLVKAGIDEEALRLIHKAKHSIHKVGRGAVAGDTEIFRNTAAPYRQHQRDSALEQLSAGQKDALQVARQANDRETVRAIMGEVGVDYPSRW